MPLKAVRCNFSVVNALYLFVHARSLRMQASNIACNRASHNDCYLHTQGVTKAMLPHIFRQSLRHSDTVLAEQLFCRTQHSGNPDAGKQKPMRRKEQ